MIIMATEALADLVKICSCTVKQMERVKSEGVVCVGTIEMLSGTNTKKTQRMIENDVIASSLRY